MTFVRQIAHTVTVLDEGQILCEGTVEEVQNNAKVIEVYLGQDKEAPSLGTTRNRMLQIENLSVSYGETLILRDVDLEVGTGRGGLPDGAQRRRQDDAAQERHGSAAAACRQHQFQGARPDAHQPGRAAPAPASAMCPRAVKSSRS